MSVAFAYRFQQRGPRTSFEELDTVVLTAAVVSDAGRTIPAGAEGTVVSVSEDGVFLTVEFAEPAGTLANVEAPEIRLIERAEP